MSAFAIAAAAMLACLVPLGLLAARGAPMEAVVAYEGATAVLVMVLVLLPEAFRRTGLFELPVLAAVLLLAGGLVFVRLLERYL